MRTLLAIAAFAIWGCRPVDDAEPGSAPTVPSEEPYVLARWRGGEVDRDDVRDRVGGDLRELEIRYLLARHDLVARTVEHLVDESILEREARARGFGDVDALLAREVDGRLTEPTDEAIAALYPARAAQLAGAPLEYAAPILREELRRRERERAYRTYLAELRTRAGLEQALPWPDLPRVDIPIADHDPTDGPADAPVTVVEFADHACTWCVAAGDTLMRLREAWPAEVRVVWKDFPLAGDPRALPAAIAAQCADEQGRFWHMHAKLLSAQHALEDDDLLRHAADLGLDPEAFEDCLVSSRPVEGIYADLEVARAASVRAAPTFFVNGIVVPGVQPWGSFSGIVERELERTASR